MQQRFRTRERRRNSTRAALAFALGGGIAYAATAQILPTDAGEAAVVDPGETERTTQHAAERRSFVVELDGGSDYLLRVVQGGLDLIVTVADPAGNTESLNSPLLRGDAELVLLAGRAAGRYAVTLYSDEVSDALAAPTLELIALPSSIDARERDAWRAMSRGAAANFAAGDDAWRAAVADYARAGALWSELGRPREQAYALLAVAMIEFWQLYDWQRSAQSAETAAALYATVGEAPLAASALQLHGSALVEQALEAGESQPAAADSLFARALALFDQARRIHEPLGNRFELGSIVNNLGYVAYNRGDHAGARGYYQQAAALLAAAGEPGAELNPLANLAVLDAEAGRVAAAVDSLERILAVLPPGKLERYRSDTLFNLGTSYRMLGYTDEALRTFADALAIQARDDDDQGRGRSLRGIGETYYALGELEIATQYLEQALVLAVATNDGRPQEGIQRTLGNIAALNGDYGAALDRHRAALRFATSATDRTYLDLLIARDLLALGRTAEAAAIAAAANASAANAGSDLLTAAALHELGRAEARQGSEALPGAIAKLQRAADLYSALGLDAERAATLHSLASTARERGELAQAHDYGAAALEAAERLRLRVADPELRAAASTTRRGYYDAHIDTLMRLHAEQETGSDEHLRTAFAVAERSRARMTADLLAEASIDLRRNVDAAVLEREAALIERLAERRNERDRLLQNPAGETARLELLTIKADLAALENELNLLELEMRRTNPQFAALTSGAALTSAQAQALLDERTVLLQYVLGTPTSYVFVLSRERIAAVALADRATIEAAARSALDDLAALAPNAAPSGAAAAELTALAELVLNPVATYLDKPQLLLALDGALQYVPFAALPIDSGDGASPRRLIAEHEVVAIPSVSAVAALPERRNAHTKTLAVIADPVLTASDPRLTVAPATLLAATTPPALLERSSVGVRLERLLATSYEADALAALVPPEQRWVARGFDANREALIDANLEQYRYVHFATHGLIDARYPGLSTLVLSQFDDDGTPRNGFLRLHDVYNLRLNADVAVLSACETALGREIRGEGLVGLTQGFMYAGARSVVASLWQAPDRATAELMTRFYRHLIQDELRPAAALHRAQTELAAEPRWADPYFWSGFVLIGDWR
jgi:CHAT domain-containing protein